MENNFISTLRFNNITICQEPTIHADVDILQNSSIIFMIFAVKDNTSTNLQDVAKMVMPAIEKTFSLTSEELEKCYSTLAIPNAFSFFLKNTVLEQYNCNITELVKDILLKAKLKENEIKKIEFLPSHHKNGNGIIKVTADVGYDFINEDTKIYKHRKFLEKKLIEGTLVKCIVDLT